MKQPTKRLLGLVLLLPLLSQPLTAAAQSTRIYIFDNGMITGLDPALFNFSADELAEVDFVNISYLIVHPEGTLMFDAGAIADEAFEGHEGPVVEGILSATQPLAPQIEAAGFSPEDIDYFALSHYHTDHTANANLFAGSTWIVQRAERDFMFSDAPEGIINPASYSALRDAETILLDDEDYDVFGDGKVLVLSTPGHTPGHQVVAVELDNAGWIVLGGDLYHYPEEIETGRVPTFEFDAELSRASRAKVQRFIDENDAT
ncbi:MAG: N-acyl homoserine lactonase family protein, partial [Gammaproteobacteria bacterium]|nr:N-acyl homoserine lactonase family protein [Gammaproteobacteria bacterium]